MYLCRSSFTIQMYKWFSTPIYLYLVRYLRIQLKNVDKVFTLEITMICKLSSICYSFYFYSRAEMDRDCIYTSLKYFIFSKSQLMGRGDSRKCSMYWKKIFLVVNIYKIYEEGGGRSLLGEGGWGVVKSWRASDCKKTNESMFTVRVQLSL